MASYHTINIYLCVVYYSLAHVIEASVRYDDIYVNLCLCIYIIMAKNIPFLLWNRGAWRFFHDTYFTIQVRGIRCTQHLHDSCPLTDVNQHFAAPGYRYYFKIGLLWRHRHMGQPLAIVASQWSIVPTGIYGRMMLRSTRVKGIAITCEALNCFAHDFIILHIVIHWETKQFIHVLGQFVCLLYLSFSHSRVSTRSINCGAVNCLVMSLPKGNAHGANDGFPAVGRKSKLFKR